MIVCTFSCRFFTGNDALEIVTSFYPLPFRTELTEEKEDYDDEMNFSVPIIIIQLFLPTFGMSFLFAGFVVFPVKEKQSRCKFQQMMSGLHVSLYWLGTLTWDFVLYSIPCVIIVAILYLSSMEEYTDGLNGLYAHILILYYI